MKGRFDGSPQARGAHEGGEAMPSNMCRHCLGVGIIEADEEEMARILDDGNLLWDIRLRAAHDWFTKLGEITCPYCEGCGRR